MTQNLAGRGRVAVLRTQPETVLEDYARLLELAGVRQALPQDKETILKINISWQTWYPACSTAPWQLEGVIRALLAAGYRNLIAAHNNTVVVDAYVGERNNKHLYVTNKYGLRNVHLYEPQYRWVRYEPPRPFLVLDKVYPEGLYIPEIMIGRNVVQLPTVKCVHPETELVLADGSLIRARDLVEGRLKAGAIPLLEDGGDIRLQAQETLISLGERGKVFPQPTSFFWRTPLNGHKLWRIQTRTGREVTVSAEHPFLTPRGWERASDLRVGDRIAVPRRIEVQGQSQPLPALNESLGAEKVDVAAIPFRAGRKYSVEFQRTVIEAYLAGQTLEEIAAAYGLPWQSIQKILRRYNIPMRRMKHWIRVPEYTSCEFWRWIGYLIAEGWVQPLRTTCRFWWTNTDPHIRQDFFELTEKLFGLQLTSRPNSGDCYVDSVQLRELLEKLGLSIPLNAANKRVPPLLFRCPNNEIAAFLSGYLDGDGSVGKKDGLHVITKSERLSKDVQILLNRLGVIAFRREKWGWPTDSGDRVYYAVSVYGDDLVTLREWIHLQSKHKQDRLDALADRRQRGKHPSNWDTIPLDREQFRRVRRGLGFSQASTGYAGLVNNIENKPTFPTRPVVKRFVELFREADAAGQYQQEIDTMAFLASDDIAWDHIVAVDEIEPDTPYLYDLTMAGPPNFVGNGIFLHNTHVFTTITGACKNAFGGLLGTKRHWTHGVIHETLVDLLMIQQDIHPGVFAVMDGTFAGDGPGPRAMRWHEKDIILASADQVAIDALSAHLQGFDPLSIPFIRIAHEMGLGVGDPAQIEIVGEDPDWVLSQNWGFVQEDTFASRGQKLIYHGALKPFEKLLLRTPLVPWSYLASNLYHNVYWYPFVGRQRVASALHSKWGRLFAEYGAEAGEGGVVMPGMEPKTVMTVAGLALLGVGLAAAGWWLWSRRRRE